MKLTIRKLVAALLGITLVCSCAAIASRTSSYGNSTVSMSGTTAAFVEFAAGADSGAGDHVSGFAIGANRTTFSVTLTAYPGASVVITDLVKVSNVHSAAHAVTLKATQIKGRAVTTATLEIFSGAASKGILDLRATSPSLALGSVPAGATFTGRVTLAFAEGSGTPDATSATIHLDVTP